MAVRWMQRTGRTPGGVIGAWWNVAICGVLIVAVPIVALHYGHPPVNVVGAVIGFAIAASMEVGFVHNLRQQLARRRGE
ncbi:hypothetical protein [Curtobacterium sp. RRHDQ10]|uniref:hypothetical protein n=1 Tax=Curtobacterium phyllosphaerae TaxID=3413379 RepID=UPI003BF3BA4F